jgi:hypothetical protein
LVEADHRLQEAAVQRVAGASQLDLDCAPVECAPLSPDESRLLHAVEMTGQGRALDPDRAGELELGAPRLALERVQDQPDRDRAAALGKCAAERTADRLRCGRQKKSERRPLRWHEP